MEVVAAGDAGNGCGKGHLSAAVEFYGFNKGAAIVGIEFQLKWKESGMVDVTQKGVKKISFERIV